jgi:aminoglycoside/choline kinase family phosphotransferase
MSYAYIQGQEVEALAYFERLLNQPLDPEARAQLQKLVDELRDKVESSASKKIGRQFAMQNAPSLNLQSC